MKDQWTVETGPELGPDQGGNPKPKKKAKYGSKPKSKICVRDFVIAPKGQNKD